jgi:tRNA threonylcarbamoyladenosine biosynthesis protein TsaE
VIEMDYKITTKCEEDTMEIAQNIESEKFPNMVICLTGDLGSGKTIFTKGFAEALGIDENITSPTFNIIKEYTTGEMNLYHMDLYRLNGDVKNLGLEEYFTKGGVVIIEWADLIEDYLPEERLDVKIKVVDEDTRILIFKPHGIKYEELCEAIL